MLSAHVRAHDVAETTDSFLSKIWNFTFPWQKYQWECSITSSTYVADNFPWLLIFGKEINPRILNSFKLTNWPFEYNLRTEK